MGGTLRRVGAASLALDSLVLQGARMPNSSALYFQGTSASGGGAGLPFGDGLRCASGTVVRLGTQLNAQNQSQYPGVGRIPASVTEAIAAPGARFYHVWYRNAASLCTASTLNPTNGLRVTWQPWIRAINWLQVR